MKARHSDTTPAWIARRFAKLEKQLRELAAAKKLQAATIGKGGLTVKDGGSVSSVYPNGQQAARFGPYFAEGDGTGHGMFLNDDSGTPMFAAVYYPDTNNSSLAAQGFSFINLIGASVSLYRSDFAAYVDVGPGGVSLQGGASGVFVSHSTTGASANCFIDPSDGRIWRSTSSRRYKQDIEDVEVDPAAVLGMQARTWRDKGEVENDPDTENRYVGFIAEELDARGLDQFVVYDADHKPEAIAYDRLSVALLAVLKDQDARIKDQDARLQALEAKAAKS